MQLAPAATVVQMRRYPMIRWNDPEGSSVRIVQHRTVVGSSASSDLVIRDATISRVHVVLEPLVQGLVVRDLDSLIQVRDLGASRCGASATAAILDEYRRREAAGQ